MYAIARYKFLDYLRRTKVSAADVPIDEVPELAFTTTVRMSKAAWT